MEQPVANPIRGKDGRFWKQQVDRAIARRQKHEPWWDANLKRFAPSVDTDPASYGQNIHTNRTFTAVERKAADEFYQRPEVTLAPTPLSEQAIAGPDGQPVLGPPAAAGQPGATIPQMVGLQAHQEIVNEQLGDDGVDASELMDAVIFDILCTQGTGFSKMGFELHAIEVPDPRDKTGTTMTAVPIVQRCFWEHFSGKQAVIPEHFRSTQWDKAPFLGMQFQLPLSAQHRRTYKLPEEFKGSSGGAKQHYDHGDGADDAGGMFTGVEIWYRSALYREDVVHPEHLTQLVMVDGIDEPVIHRDSPYQTLDDRGQLTPDSLIGFPIHPFSVRKMTDTAYVPSDATMIGPLEAELDVYRTQQVQFRDAATLKFMANGDVLPKDALDKIVRAPVGGIVVVPGEAFVGDGAIKELPQGSLPRENFTGQQAIDDDIARTLGVDASGAGVNSQTSQTATETQVIQANANARLEKERSKILKRYIKGVTKFSTLVQRYLPVTEAARIVGPERAAIWDVWRKQVPSAVAFTAMPDSALRVDQAVDRKQAQELYSFLANDPYVAKGRAKLLERLLRKFHIDPTGIVSPPDPPKPDPSKVSLAFKGEDFVSPQGPIVLGILEQLGLKIDPTWVTISQAMMQQSLELAAQAEADKAAAKQSGNTQHGGKLAQQESLSKHASDETGGMQGIGGQAALGAPGGMIQ